MLSSDLDSEEEKDKSALDALLTTLILHLNMQSKVGFNHRNFFMVDIRKNISMS